MSLTEQQRWNRYVHAINYCIERGYYIDIEATVNGNLKSIIVYNPDTKKLKKIKLKAKKYKCTELLYIIINNVGYTSNK